MNSSCPEIRPARDHAEREAALAVRRRVFVQEQGGPAEEEPDEWDAAARQFVVVWDGRVVGTARLYQPQFGVGQIGRLALLPDYRGRGWGNLLMSALLEHARALGLARVELNAQLAAAGFYERHGFAPEGDPFLEAGLPHVRMALSLASEPPGASQR